MSCYNRRQRSPRNPTPVNPVIEDSRSRSNFDNNNSRVKDKDALIIDMDTTPSFGQWIKVSWQDLITMLLLGTVGMIINFAEPIPSRSFPIYSQNGDIVYPQFAYPLRKNIIPIWVAILLASLIPLLIIFLTQFRIRSFWDANNAITGLLYSLIIAGVFQVFLKWLIGGLRPHFLTVCEPIIPTRAPIKARYGPRIIMYDRNVCTGDKRQINNSLESFPSSQSTVAFSGFVYLAIYLNAKLKIWSNYHSAMWKMALLWSPILIASLISASLTIDGFHNWYDCLVGGIIGTVMSLSAYRMVFASIWDYHNNHIPLNRHAPFSTGRSGLTATRKAGWGEKIPDSVNDQGNNNVRQNTTNQEAVINLIQRPTTTTSPTPDHVVAIIAGVASNINDALVERRSNTNDRGHNVES